MKFKLLVLIFFAQISAANSSTSERIEGVTNFLVERANETYFYIFENKMKRNSKFKCYLPNTYQYIEEGNLKALLKSNEIWQETLEADFEILGVRAIAKGLSAAVDFNTVAISMINEYAQVVRVLDISIDGKLYPLAETPVPRPSAEVLSVLNGFYDDFNKFSGALIDFDKKLAMYKDVCSATEPVKDAFKADIAQVEQSFKALDGWLEHVEKHRKTLKLNETRFEQACASDQSLKMCNMRDRIVVEFIPSLKKKLKTPVGKAIASASALALYIKNNSNRKSYTGKAVEAFRVIKDQDIEANKTLKQLRHYTMFIAQLADAEDANLVEGIMREYSLPVTSFLEKRDSEENTVFITSYFGYGGGSIINDDEVTSSNKSGFYVPIGLEYSLGYDKKGALSLMLSPFDFGYPVSLKMNGEKQDLELDDIIAPSLSIAYGVPDYPFVIGVALQIGLTDPITNIEEERLLLFLGFDMPLMSF